MISLQCPRCQTSFSLPETLPLTIKQEALSLVHQQQRLLAMKVLMESRQIPLGDAKAAALHIPREINCCHRCNNPIEAIEVVICTKCKSLNLNWQ